jgi:hypothetical protein
MHSTTVRSFGRGISRAAWCGVAVALALASSGCASSGGLTGSSGNISAPSNYRQAIAAKLRQWEKVSDIRSAEISQPHNKFLGLIVGGTRPTVCVKLVMPNLIGSNAAYYYDFYFDNGEVDGYRQGATSQFQVPFIGCGNEPLTKFAELVG